MKIFQNSGILLTFGAVGMIALVVLVFLFSSSGGDLMETPNVPQEEWDRRITSQEKNDLQRVVNDYDGYAITVPARWQVPPAASVGEGGLKIYYHPAGYAPAGIEAPEGMFLHIYKKSLAAGQSITQWITEHTAEKTLHTASLGSYEAYWVDDPIMEFEPLSTNLVPAENATRHSYFILSEGAIFALSCIAEGEQHAQWVSLCEEVLPSFEILR